MAIRRYATLADPRLTDILTRSLLHHGGIVLDTPRVYWRLDHNDPDLHYCVTWGTGRYAAGLLRWWPDMQRLADESARLYGRFGDWSDLIATVGAVDGEWIFTAEGLRLGRLAVRVDFRRQPREPDNILRSRLVNCIGGNALVDADEDPRDGLVEELSTPPVEPRSRYERLLDDDILEPDSKRQNCFEGRMGPEEMHDGIMGGEVTVRDFLTWLSECTPPSGTGSTAPRTDTNGSPDDTE